MERSEIDGAVVGVSRAFNYSQPMMSSWRNWWGARTSLGGRRAGAQSVGWILLLLTSLDWSSPGAIAGGLAQDESAVDFIRDIRPILADRCFTCHGPDEGSREARLRLDTLEGLSKPLGRFHLLKAGHPEDSELYLRLTEPDPDYRMPPVESGEALDPREIELIRRWIVDGAKWESHWAYAPFREVQVPDGNERSPSPHPIDSFVRRRLESEGFTPAPEADRSSLLRRLSLDLVGMIPTPEELSLFLQDREEGAYERAVDRMLESSAYAEHQTQHWLDLARYADSHGFTIDGGRSIWPYRDWVLNAIDQDLPFDEFTRRQLAGDLLPNPSRADLIATGFHRNTQINQEGGAKDEENRVNAVIDRVDTTASVWLGSSMTCARCHTHKYDPISQTEYFQLFAFFNQTRDGGVSSEPFIRVPDAQSEAALQQHEAEDERLAAELRAVEEQARQGWTTWIPSLATGSNGPELRIEEDASIRSLGQNPVTSDYVLQGEIPEGGVGALRLEALPHQDLPHGGPGRSGGGNFVLERLRLFTRSRAEDEWRELELHSASASYSQGAGPEEANPYPVGAALRDEARQGWAVSPRFGLPHVAHFQLRSPLVGEAGELRLVLEQNWGNHHVLGRFRVAFTSNPPEGAVERDEDWESAWTARAEHQRAAPRLPTTLVMSERRVPRPNRLFIRGDFMNPGQAVRPGIPEAMNAFDFEGPLETRLDLANWLTDPRNALVHRVTVNRDWQHFFGRGLVETESDFGIRGAAPSHPDLLEWLARDFVDSGFSRKALHKRIVTSATYRQASRARASLDAIDPRQQWLGRQASRRMAAESIRDSALRASGLLAQRVGGPPVQPPQPAGVFSFTQSHKSWKAAEDSDRYRRTLYTRRWRSSTYPFLTTFDAPVANVACTRRGSSNTALQALTLANDPMVLEIAAALGRRVCAEKEGDRERVAHAFSLCLNRDPEGRELDVLVAHLEEVRALHRSQESDGEERAWTAVARVLFNLDEFVSRD